MFLTAILSRKFTTLSALSEFALMAIEARPAVNEKFIALDIHKVSRRLKATSHDSVIRSIKRYFFRQPRISITRPSNIEDADDIISGYEY